MKGTIIAGTILCACLAVALYASKAQAYRSVKHVDQLREDIESERGRVATLTTELAAREAPAKLKELLASRNPRRSANDPIKGATPNLDGPPANMVGPTVDRIIRAEDLGRTLPEILDESAHPSRQSTPQPAPQNEPG